MTSAEERLGYYAERFRLVEVDSTYYTPPNERNGTLWASRTPAGFTFDVKAFSLLTQHPTKVSALYKELRPATGKANVYLGDLEPAVVDQVWERFLSALEWEWLGPRNLPTALAPAQTDVRYCAVWTNRYHHSLSPP